ncbi:MAG: EF-hand domain-containing protein [Verrucomicrobiales bacterium]
MKTISVYFIIAGFLLPSVALAGPDREPEGRDGLDSAEGPEGAPPYRRQMAKFAEVWKAADKDSDGMLTWEEFSEMKRVSKVPEENRRRLFERLDKNKNGMLDRREMGKLAKAPGGHPLQRLWEMDLDKSGGVSLEEFTKGKLAAKLPAEKVVELFMKLDTNGDGEVTPTDRPKRPAERERGWRGGKRPEEMGPEEMRPEEMRPEEMRPEEMRPEEMRPEKMGPEEMGPEGQRKGKGKGKRALEAFEEL